MRPRWIAALALTSVLLASSGALGEGIQPVDGFLHADAPAQFSGDIDVYGSGETLWVTTDEAQPDQEITFRVEDLRVTTVTRELESAESPRGLNVSVVAPTDSVERDTTTYTNATVTLEGFGPASDALVYPSVHEPLETEIHATSGTTQIDSDADGLLVQDGFRERNDINDSSDQRAFDWDHELNGPQLVLEGLDPIELDGALRGYAWEVNVTVENASSEDRIQTGYERQESREGTLQSEEYTYVLVEASGARAEIDTGSLDAELYGSAMQVDVDGAASLPGAQGTLSTDDGAFHASQPETAILRGNFSMEVTPKPAPGAERITASVEGQIRDTTLSLKNDQNLASTQTVAAAAGGATAFGLAAWYLTSAKGLSLAAVPFLGARRSRDPPTSADPDVSVDEPGDLLFDPDRFALYHLIRERPGLTARTCAETAGVPDAGEQLELLVDHGLLETVSDEPRRYMLPGAVEPDDAQRIALLREPGALRVAEILAVHGLAPETHLLDRVEATNTPLSREGAAHVIDRLVEEGLAYREQGPDGRVADSADALHELLDRMGETSVPRIS